MNENTNRDYFAQKAGIYEQNVSGVDNVENIANSIIKAVSPSKEMHLLDFGSGTGLLLERIAPFVAKITALDVSKAMNSQLEAKLARLKCDVEIVEMDLSRADLDKKFDGIISSMTMHHIENIGAMLKKFYSMIRVGGFIAIADLDTEDGSFHTEDTGIFHLGFDRNEIANMAKEAGFGDVRVSSASVVHRPDGDYPVFLLTATRL
ncbi:MAG: class I SAM-dependent methyltransferase [Candidatus Riflebacteria bacterium]|nr:class I SAM-dependent methyltransferase [Candidatus Riflebacteria bacterium]